MVSNFFLPKWTLIHFPMNFSKSPCNYFSDIVNIWWKLFEASMNSTLWQETLSNWKLMMLCLFHFYYDCLLFLASVVDCIIIQDICCHSLGRILFLRLISLIHMTCSGQGSESGTKTWHIWDRVLSWKFQARICHVLFHLCSSAGHVLK